MILTAEPTLSTVQRFRGVADIYKARGQTVARKWPRNPRQPGTPAQLETWRRWRDMLHWVRSNPLSWFAHAKATSTPPTASAHDVRRKAGYQLAVLSLSYPLPDITKVSLNPNTPPGQTTIDIYCADFPGFDPRQISFRFRPSPGHRWLLRWYEHRKRIDRYGKTKITYLPLTTFYALPSSLSVNPGQPKYRAKILSITSYVSFFPVINHPLALDLYTGALYHSQDLP